MPAIRFNVLIITKVPRLHSVGTYDGYKFSDKCNQW